MTYASLLGAAHWPMAFLLVCPPGGLTGFHALTFSDPVFALALRGVAAG